MPKQLINFAIPKDMLSQVDALSKKEDRSRSETIREALKIYLTRNEQFENIRKISQNSKLSEKKASKLIDEIRSLLIINK